MHQAVSTGRNEGDEVTCISGGGGGRPGGPAENRDPIGGVGRISVYDGHHGKGGAFYCVGDGGGSREERGRWTG